jgi:hypothetical protein
MAISRGPKLVTNGLVFCVDAADKNSYIGSGTTWTDVSGNAYNGTLTNGPTFNGSNGGGIVFDGVDDYADFGNVLASLTNLSLECFVKFGTQSTSFNGIISKTLSNADGYEIRTSNGATSTTTIVEFRYVGDSASIGFGTLTNGIWYHLVATGANGSQKTYINGVQAGSNTIALSPSANSNSLVIGKLAYAGLYANMTMGCARIYNRALTASEIQQNYNSTKPRFGL